MIMKSFFDAIDSNKKENEVAKELSKLLCDTDLAWHTNDIPDREGKYLVFCNVDGVYAKAVAKVHFLWEEYAGREPEWKIDHFLTQDQSLEKGKQATVLAWAELPKDQNARRTQIIKTVERLTKLVDIETNALILLKWICMFENTTRTNYAPDLYVVMKSFGAITKLKKIISDIESFQVYYDEDYDISTIERLCENFNDIMAWMRDVHVYFYPEKDFDCEWERVKSVYASRVQAEEFGNDTQNS